MREKDLPSNVSAKLTRNQTDSALTHQVNDFKSHETSHDLTTVPENTPSTGAKKESPYDHLPVEKEALLNGEENAQEQQQQPLTNSEDTDTVSDTLSNGKKSPNINDCTDLDYIPRSSPTIRNRPITPEHAQHLRKHGGEKDGLSRTSTTMIKGRKSPPSKLSKKSNTMANFPLHSTGANTQPDDNSLYNTPRPVSEEDSSLYNTPRPSSETDVYKVPKSVMDTSPPIGEEDSSESTLDVRPSSERRESLDVYKVPSSIPVQRSETNNPDTRDLSSSSHTAGSVSEEYYGNSRMLNNSASGNSDAAGTASEGFYNVPRSLGGGGGDIYNVPRAQGNDSDNHYNIPNPQARSTSPSSPKSRQLKKNNYESIDVGAPTEDTTVAPSSRKLRPARSFESLHKLRINSDAGFSGHISPPLIDGRPAKCCYVDIDLKPAKNAPLPPLPSPGVLPPLPVADSMYAEITEEDLHRNRMRVMSLSSSQSSTGGVFNTLPNRSQQHQQNPGHALYNTPPPTHSRYHQNAALEGMTKAKELAEEEGYELFLPAQTTAMGKAKSFDISYNTHAVSKKSNNLLEKYNINLEGSRHRPHSESDVLSDSTQKDSKKLGTSIPTIVDDDPLTDEYIIVTGPDRRPKPGHTRPHPSAAVSAYRPKVSEEYESMESARANLAAYQDSRYSTPNPSLWGGAPPPSNNYTTRHSPPKNADSAPLLPPRHHLDSDPSAGIDLAGMSPTDSEDKPLYGNCRPPYRRQSSSLSNSSSGGGGGGGEEVDGLGVRQPTLMKIMAGSPMDRTMSNELK